MSGNPITQLDRFRKYARDELQCIDFGDAVFPDAVLEPIKDEIRELLDSKGIGIVEALTQHSEMMPSQLRRKGAENLFAQYEGFEDIDAKNVVVFPETSTALTKYALLTLVEDVKKQNKTDKVAIIHSEGTFRYNFRIEDMVGGKLFTAPIDKKTGKISPKTLEDTIAEAKRQGYTVAGLVLETPNNPLMQTYSTREMKALLKTAEKHQLSIVNDIFFAGTESADIEAQKPLVSVASDEQKQHIVTVSGVRRQLGLDNFAKAGFAASHNQDWINKMERRIKALHAFFPEGHFVILDHMLSKLGKDKTDWTESWRNMHTDKRRAAVQDFKNIQGVTILYPSEVGPYFNIGFTKDVRDKMLRLGLASEEDPSQIDSYKAAKYFTLTGLDSQGKHGAALMPLCCMGLSVEGFRINALLSDKDREIGVQAIKKALVAIENGVTYDSLGTQISQVERNMEQFFRERS